MDRCCLLACLYENTGSYCCHHDVGVGVTLLSFTSKFFYVMGKTLSGKLSFMRTDRVKTVMVIIIILAVPVFRILMLYHSLVSE